MNYYELDIEYAMQILYIAKIFHDHGRLGNLLDELDEDVSLADDQIGLVNLTMVESIFEDTRYYSQRGKRMEGYGYTQDRDAYVLRDRLLTRYDDLCRKLEMKLGITKVENQFARDLDSAIQRNMQFNSYDYDYLWADSTVDRKGAKIVLFLFEEFATFYDIPDGLFSILDFCQEGIPKLEAALAEASKDKVVQLPVKIEPKKEAA